MADRFADWRARQDDIHVETDWKHHCPYNAQSVPLEFPSSIVTLPLFETATASGTRPDETTGNLPNTESHDIIMHVGGPVWGLAWCPSLLELPHLPPGSSNTGRTPSSGSRQPLPPPLIPTRYLAVGCHPTYSPTNRIGVPVTGPGVIQIWEIPDPDYSPSPRENTPSPRMALAIAHDGGLTWQCKWCPVPGLTDPTNINTTNSRNSSGDELEVPRLGLLAAALGDGSVRVWAVPQPAALREALGAQAPPLEEPLVISLPPVVILRSSHINGSLPCVLDWLPAFPNDLLVVGCWNGHAAVVKLLPTSNQQNRGLQSPSRSPTNGSTSSSHGGQKNVPLGCEIISFFPADSVPLRAIKWLPAEIGTMEGVSQVHRSTFATVGHEGAIKIWDTRDEFQPMYWQLLTTGVIYDLTWTNKPFGLMVALEDASIRGVLLGAKDMLGQKGAKGAKPAHSCIWRGDNAGGLWAIDANPISDEVAYAGEDGVVGSFTAEYWWDNRKRREHVPLGAFRMENGCLKIMSSGDLEAAGGSGLYQDRTVDRMQALVATQGKVCDEMQAVYRVAWGPGGAGWLASGGGAGVVRCQWITVN